jgi:hypothetical protein
MRCPRFWLSAAVRTEECVGLSWLKLPTAGTATGLRLSPDPMVAPIPLTKESLVPAIGGAVDL